MVPQRTGGHVVVDTVAGPVRGFQRVGSAVFLGIPFAEPPFGPNRLLAPVPRRPWRDVRDALAYGPTPQRTALAEITTIPEPSIPGEDVLSLNVFTPRTDGALPVLVYVHGGGYVAGSPASPWYDGVAFNRDDVVVVTIAYRLGFEGFGWLPDAPANRGVLDQVLALEWVRDNIARFGGDPAKVTIAGQSAGGGAVLTLMTLRAATGLFRAVAPVSGVPADIALADARITTHRLAEQLHVAADRTGFASVPEPALIRAQGSGFETVQSPSADDLLRIARGLVHFRTFGPVIDGESITESVVDAIRSGVGGELPLFATATRDEFSGFALANRAVLNEMDADQALIRLGESDPQRFLASLPEIDAAAAIGQWVTDTMFRAPLVDLADVRTGPAATWLGEFTWRSRRSGIAEHCLDVPFLFDVLEDPDVARVAGISAPQGLADALHGAFVRFVRDGDPGWCPYSADRTVALFDEPVEMITGGYDSARSLLPADGTRQA